MLALNRFLTQSLDKLHLHRHVNKLALMHASELHTTPAAFNKAEKYARDKIKKHTKKSTIKPIVVKASMTVGELATAMGKPSQHVFDCLEQMRLFFLLRNRRESTILPSLEIITSIVRLSGFRYQLPGATETDYAKVEAELDAQDDSIAKRRQRASAQSAKLVRRHPIVTIMGHVDHGKTTLLDALRGTRVVESEFGGITQHIGAFNVTLPTKSDSSENGKNAAHNRSITFLDTPGHAAFSMMRSRGARVTDIVVLVIAAEDGVMAQTEESIQHAKESGCPIIVAINKIDKATPAQIAGVKSSLLKYELIPEDMGGDVQVVPISALKGTNLDMLKEVIWAQSEIMELRGDPTGLAEGYIIESTQDIHRGKLATVLVQRGTLKRGDFIVSGQCWCRVKTLDDPSVANLSAASVSQAVQIMGWKDLPGPGDEVLQVESEHAAKALVEIRHKKAVVQKQKFDLEEIKKKREEHTNDYKPKLAAKQAKGHRKPVTYIPIGEMVKNMAEKRAEALLNPDKETDTTPAAAPTFSVIVKTDVNGSLEAILNVMETYEAHHKVRLDLVHFDVGPVKKTDMDMAELFNSVVYAFNLPANPEVEASASKMTVTVEGSSSAEKKSRVRHFNVIYKMFDDMRSEINERVVSVDKEELIGEATVLQVFDYTEEKKKGTITVAGGRCLSGMLDRKANFRLVRGGTVVKEKLTCHSLKHVKTDVSTIKQNVEFGLAFEQKNVTPEKGDTIVCYNLKKVKEPVEWNLGF